MKYSENPRKSMVASLRMYEAKESFFLMMLGMLTGAGAGLAAVLLNWSVHAVEILRNGYDHTWLMILLPAAGAGLGIFIQRNMLHDRAGHGVPDVIKSVTTEKGILQRRMLISRLISSFLTVGSGGAAGLEGPIVISGGSTGSVVGSIFQLPERRRILLIACGTSGAIGAIFNAPLTGLVFSLEVILGEWKARNLVPTITSAAVATLISRMLMGDKISFPHSSFTTTFLDFPASILLGIACALMGWVFVKSLELFGRGFQRIALPHFLIAALGGLGVGVIGFFQHETMGEGYDLIHHFILNQSGFSLYVVIGIVLLRLITTSLTLSSGGSGGVFAPSLFFGSALGFLFGRLLNQHWMWGNFSSPGAFALIGMAGLVAGVMNAPLTGMFLVFEISDSYGLILPLMVCSLTSMLVYRLLERGSIYTHDMLVHGRLMERGTGLHLLTEIGPEEIMEKCPVLQGNTSLHDFLKRYGDNLPDHVAILDEANQFQGLVFLTDLKPILLEVELYHLIFLESLADHQVPRLTSGFRPDEAALLFAKTSREALPVLAENGDFQGIVTKTLIFDSIRREIMVQD